ncbi:histidine kinase [Actinoplanes sp. NPDC026670]|uniref:sensor histidine kinase n=1 Tax=Actinoplanes sp. NPDC026670 TaxID=3154700 RepID=UPI0033E9AC09
MSSRDRERVRAFVQDLLLTALAVVVDAGVNLGKPEVTDRWVLSACTTAVMSTILLRRRFPAALLGLQVGYVLLILALKPHASLAAGLLIALYAVASRRDPSRSVLALLAAAVAANAQIISLQRLEPMQSPATVVFLQGLLMFGVWSAGYRSWITRARLTERKAAEADMLREERLRIARELHDIVAGSVSVMVVQAAGAQTVLRTDIQRTDAALGVIQQSGTQAMAELRRLLGLLRSAGGTGDDATLGPGVDGIGELLESMRSAGLTITYRVSGTPAPVDPSVSLACYRIVQESLTNTVKHAGVDASVDVHLDWRRRGVILSVADGGGQQPADGELSTGHGLLGLRERVVTLGGVFAAGPTADGFRVRAELPVTNSGPLAAT